MWRRLHCIMYPAVVRAALVGWVGSPAVHVRAWARAAAASKHAASMAMNAMGTCQKGSTQPAGEQIRKGMCKQQPAGFEQKPRCSETRLGPRWAAGGLRQKAAVTRAT